MMNLLALGLILSSIAAASFFSPPSDPGHQVLREGHRLIVVEFERQIPQPSSFSSSAGEAKEELLDSASVFPNVGQGLSQPPKAKISSVFTDTKQKTNKLEASAADAVKSIADKVKHMAARIEESVSDAVKSTAEEATRKAAGIEESTSAALKTAAEKTNESAGKAAKSAADNAMAAGEDVAGNISASASKTADMAVATMGDVRRKLTDMLQRAWDLGRDVAAFVGAGLAGAARSAAAVAHLLGFATAYGTCVWVTFASNHVLASAMPRQQFGMVQSRIYAVYFRFLVLAVGVGFAGHVLSGKERVQGYNLIALLAIVLLNLVWLEPKATKAMFEKMKLEKEEGRGRDVAADLGAEPAVPSSRKEAAPEKGRLPELQKTLKSLNNYSSFLNVLTLMGLSWHLVYLA